MYPINFTSFFCFQIAHFEVGDILWRLIVIPDSEDEIGDDDGDNMLSTFLLELSGASCIEIMLGGCDLILESSTIFSSSCFDSFSAFEFKNQI